MKHSPSLQPDPKFVSRLRGVFLAAFREKYPASKPSAGWAMKYFFRGAGVGVACTLLLGGASVYADQTNVGTGNILYPLKRSQEVLQLALANDAEKPVVQLKLTQRRLEELETVEQEDIQSEKIPSLKKDLHDSVDRSLSLLPTIGPTEVEDNKPSEVHELSATGASVVSEPQTPAAVSVPVSAPKERSISSGSAVVQRDDKAAEVCRSLQTLIGSDSPGVRAAVRGGKEDLLKKFKQKCSSFLTEEEITDLDMVQLEKEVEMLNFDRK